MIITSSRFCSMTSSDHDIKGRTGSDCIPQQSSINVMLPEENDIFTDGCDIAAKEDQVETIYIDSISVDCC